MCRPPSEAAEDSPEEQSANTTIASEELDESWRPEKEKSTKAKKGNGSKKNKSDANPKKQVRITKWGKLFSKN